MPATMRGVSELLSLCRQNGVDNVTLLVVPGLEWSEQQLDQLRCWVRNGYRLAGHGWVHRCETVRGWKHRLHSQLLSRNVAEHLSVTAEGSIELICRCHDWFERAGLQHCGLYVPPAWALQRLSAAQLKLLPFSMIETMRGVVWTQSAMKRSLPLVGFEADTSFRKFFVSGFNRCNLKCSQWVGRPLRISIHPQDHHLRLANQLERFLKMPMETMYYDGISKIK